VETQLKLAELVPVATLERLRALFESVTGVPVVFTDSEGVPLTDIEDPLKYCGGLVCAQEVGRT